MGVEVQKQRKNQPGMIAFVLILLLLVLGLGGYIIYDKVTEKNRQAKESKPKEETKIEKKPTKIAKIDETKDYVYQAEYDAGNQYTENTMGEGTYDQTLADNWTVTPITNGTTYLKDLVVPFININSEAARTANGQLKTLYEEYAKRFDEMAKNSPQRFGTQILTYRTYLLDDCLSIVVAHGYQYTDVLVPSFVTYNFSLTDGSLLSFEQVYQIAGFHNTDIHNKVETAITSVMTKNLADYKDPLKDSGNGGYYPDGTNFDTYNNESIASYHTSIDRHTLPYYIDENQKLYVIVTLSLPVGSGKFDTIIPVI